MSRIELVPNPDAKPSASVQRMSPRYVRGFPKALFSLVVVTVLIGGGGWYLLHKIRTPVPAHHDVPQGGTIQEELSEQIDAMLAQRLTASGIQDKNVVFTFSESALTRSLQDTLQENAFDVLDETRVQVAVLPGKSVEFFLPVMHNAFAADVRIQVRPALQDGLLLFTLESLYVGELPVSPHVFDWMLSHILLRAANALNAELGKYMVIQSVELTGGEIQVQGDFVAEVIQ